MSHEISFTELLNTRSDITEQPKHQYKPIWILAAENNAKDKILTERKAKHDRNFTGC